MSTSLLCTLLQHDLSGKAEQGPQEFFFTAGANISSPHGGV